MAQRNVVSSAAIIAGYSENGHFHAALAFINEMHVQVMKPNSFVIVSALPACAKPSYLLWNKASRSMAIKKWI